MTVSTTRTLEFNIDTIVKTAYQLAGLADDMSSTSDPWYAARRSKGMTLLEVICKELQGVAFIERHQTRFNATAIAGNPVASFGSFDDMLTNAAMFAMYEETGSDTQLPINIVSNATYEAIINKDEEGTPSLMYFDRLNKTAYLWPVPYIGGTLSMLSLRLTADVKNASDTLDFERHWTGFFVWELAHQLAMSGGISLDRVAYLGGKAEGKKKDAIAFSSNLAPLQMHMGHRTPWT